ncbi:MAG: hypothetical protein GX552_08820 [Chloroflexi bacterium]|jgi:hypothetical protein|nr:hypothetical protein [Chloroflexota bacterium]
MNGRERLWAALRCQPVDELPVMLQGLAPGHPSRVYRDASWDAVLDRYAETGDVLHMFPPVTAPSDDTVKVTTRLLARTDDYQDVETHYETPSGSLTMVRRDQFLTGATIKHAVTSPKDLPAARWVLGQRLTVDLEATRECYESISQQPNTLPLLTESEPIEQVVGLMGAETFALLLAEDPAALQELVEIAAQPTYERLETVLSSGIQPGVWTSGAEWVTPPYAGPATFRRLVVPYLTRMVDIAHRHGCPVFSHCHGKLRAVLDDYVGTGIDASHPFEAPPMGDITPRELRDHMRQLGRRVCWVGNIQLDDVLRAPTAEIARQVDALLEVFADWQQGGFILSVSGTATCRQVSAQAVKNLLYLLDRKRG